MNRRYYMPYAVVLAAGILLAGCGKKQDLSLLSDLGGVYSSSFKDLKLDVEISGRLSEGTAAIKENNKNAVPVTVQTASGYDNKLLRWGISRKPDNQLPAADPGAPELLAKYGGLYLCNTEKKELCLTFDEGYENGYTPKILDALKANDVKAVFFITGPYLKEHENLVKRMVDEGHTVGNHTIHHPSLPEVGDSVLEEEVTGLDRVFHEKFGQHMRFLRPPKGEYSERTLAITQKLGYRNMFWSFAYDDWHRDKVRGPEYAYNIVMRNLHNGAIILLHAVSKDNADALDSIIKGAKQKGYTFIDPASAFK